MKTIIFGGSGFLGSHVADALTAAGHEVVIFDLAHSPYLTPAQKFIQGNILDRELVAKTIAGAQVVYNFAGLTDIDAAADKPIETVELNVLGNTILLEAARQAGVTRFVFASTVYVYSESGGFYRCSKQACELYIENFQKKYGLHYTNLRYGTLYGERADRRNSVHRFLTEAIEHSKITYPGSGEEIREYIHVQDAARGSIEILSHEFTNQTVLLVGHHPMKVKDLMTMIQEILGHNLEIIYQNQPSELHYQITPYHFRPKVARKLVSHSYLDMGQGLLNCLEDIARKLKC